MTVSNRWASPAVKPTFHSPEKAKRPSGTAPKGRHDQREPFRSAHERRLHRRHTGDFNETRAVQQ